MSLTEILYGSVKDRWERTLDKPFVREMAEGSLEEEKFKNYMVQDYYYLKDYIVTLQLIQEKAGPGDVGTFLGNIITAVKDELEAVHIPNMKKLGITDDKLNDHERAKENSEYAGYQKKIVEDGGVIAGLAAMLHCSWMYAFIGTTMKKRYPEQIAHSPYKEWFDAYSSDEYLNANQMWIDKLDEVSEGIDDNRIEELCDIFRNCADHEDSFWDMAYAAKA